MQKPDKWNKKVLTELGKLIKTEMNYGQIAKAINDKFGGKHEYTAASVEHAKRKHFNNVTKKRKGMQWTKEITDKLEHYYFKLGKKQYECAELLSKEFKCDITPHSVGCVLSAKLGKSKGVIWTEDKIAFVKEKYLQGYKYQDIADLFNKKFDMNVSKLAVRDVANNKLRLSEMKEERKSSIKKNEIMKLATVFASAEDIDDVDVDDIAGQIEHDKERYQLQLEKRIADRKYKEAIKDLAFQDNVIKVMKENIQAIRPVQPPKKLVFAKKTKTEETAVLCLGDLHIGEVVDSEETGGINHYDLDVFRYRLQFLAETVVDIIRNKMVGYNIKNLEIFGLGDYISGMIHSELVETSGGKNIIDWLNFGSVVLAQFVQELAMEFEKITISCIVGNHGRLHQKPRFKNRYINFDYIMANQWSLLLQNQKNVSFNIPKSFYYIRNVEGHNFLLLHGDNNKSWMGIPWYSIKRNTTSLSEILNNDNEKIYSVCMGHFHQNGSLDTCFGGQIILNGSMVGGNEYSLGKMFTTSHPKQILMAVHPKKGKTFQFDINLSFAKEDGNIRYQYNENDLMVEQIRNLIKL